MEAFKTEKAAGVTGDLRYYSNPATSGQVNLPTYFSPDVGVITDTQYVRLDGSNGYATLLWNAPAHRHAVQDQQRCGQHHHHA